VFQQLVNGLMLGGVYALFAVGLTLSLGVLRVMNLAHGVTLALAAIAAVKLTTEVSLPLPVVLLFGAAVGGIIGVALELVAFRPLRQGPSEKNIEMASLVSSLAVLYILMTVAQQWTNAESVRFPADVFQSQRIDLGFVDIRSILLITFASGIILVAACWYVLGRTQIGRAVRAVALDDEAAGMVGINANRLKLGAMVVSSALAGIAGVLIGLSLGAIDFTVGESQLLRGFTVVILGGIGSVPGALVGGLILGISEGATVHWFGSAWQHATAFALLIAILLVRPQGLFGKPALDRA
jgi:branched-chain amino acid transport system permease protein